MKKLLLLCVSALCGSYYFATGNSVPWHLSPEGNLGSAKFSLMESPNEVQTTAVPQDWKGDLVIPSKINGHTIRQIGEAEKTVVFSATNRPFLNCKQIKSIRIPATVEKIYPSAFQGCTSLSKFIVDPKNKHYKSMNGLILSKDGTRLELMPPAVQIVKIPNGIKSLEANAFDGCANIRVVSIPQSVTSYSSGTFSNLEPEAVVSSFLPNNMSRKKLKRWVIPEGTKFVGFGTWNWVNEGYANKAPAPNLKSVKIPKSATVIGAYAFKALTALETIEIPAGVTAIEAEAFAHCYSLKSIVIPSSVVEIGEGAFGRCDSLTSVTLLNGACKIGRGAFHGVSPTTLVASVVPNGLDTKKLTKWIIPEGTTSIIGEKSLNKDPFHVSRSYDKVEEVQIPSSVQQIGPQAFSGFKALKSIVIPEGVTSIGDEAFDDCSSLTSITIPSSVTSIGKSAFSGCRALTSVSILNETCEIATGDFGSAAFEGIAPTTLMASIIPPHMDIRNLTNWIIPEGTINVVGRGRTSSIELGYQKVKTITEVQIPSSVQQIGPRAFWDFTALKSIVIPEGVTSIGDEAFEGCADLTSITLPSSVALIGKSAFSGCTSLTSVTIPSGVTSIGESAFSGCKSLTSITLPSSVTSIGESAFSRCESLTSVIIPEGVTTIEYGVFSECKSLTSITIPSGVTSIGGSSFSGCSGLTSMTMPEGVISIGEEAFVACSNLLGTLIIPAAVQEIGGGAFAACTSLSGVEFCGQPPKVEESPFILPFYSSSTNIKGVYSIANAGAWREVLANGQWHGIQMSMKEAWIIYTAIGGLLVLVLGGVAVVFLKKRKKEVVVA